MTKEALKLAMEALEKCNAALAEELAAWDIDPPLHHVLEASNACGPAITALREALVQPEQDPVAWDNCRSEKQCRSWCGNSSCVSHWNYNTPPPVAEPHKRKPLTIKDIKIIATYCDEHVTNDDVIEITRRVEAAHGITEEKNT